MFPAQSRLCDVCLKFTSPGVFRTPPLSLALRVPRQGLSRNVTIGLSQCVAKPSHLLLMSQNRGLAETLLTVTLTVPLTPQPYYLSYDTVDCTLHHNFVAFSGTLTKELSCLCRRAQTELYRFYSNFAFSFSSQMTNLTLRVMQHLF